MNPRQERFAHEFVVDHNATKAAIRAGYSEKRAKQTGRDLRKRPDVAALIEKLEADRQERLGYDADWVIRQLVKVYEKSFEGSPRTDRNGAPVYVKIDGETRLIYDWSPSGANKALETLAKHLGLLVERHQVEATGDYVFTLKLDRELDDDDVDDD